MKDLPIWARWNGQEVLGIVPGKNGWHRYYFRRHAHGAPMHRLADQLADALRYIAAKSASWLGKPWRRLGALRKARG